ncbi:MAG: RCC1 domain-containing protein [Acidimicrobiaceae bacterium]|nr:RCC1 domain-containing protein [Acidimicrobiaceae bacterium]
MQADGAVACWDNHTKADPYLVSGTEPPQGEFVKVSMVGDGGYCALRNDGSVVCDNYWGSSRLQPPDGEFTDVTAGDEHACAIRTDGTVACWGSPAEATTVMPSP